MIRLNLNQEKVRRELRDIVDNQKSVRTSRLGTLVHFLDHYIKMINTDNKNLRKDIKKLRHRQRRKEFDDETSK